MDIIKSENSKVIACEKHSIDKISKRKRFLHTLWFDQKSMIFFTAFYAS